MKINTVEKITELKHINLFSISYQDRRNSEKKWIFASRSDCPNPLEAGSDQPDAVVIVPYHVKSGKLVLIREFRVALGDWQYGFPAGLVDTGESVKDAGKRELLEETGLSLVRVLKQSPAVYSSSGLTDESVSLLYAECEGTPSTQFNEDSEDIEVVMVTPEQAVDMLFDKTIKFDVKTWIVLNSFAGYGTI